MSKIRGVRIVDGRCDGERDMSTRDQRVGTSHPDRVTEEEKENEVSHNVESPNRIIVSMRL